MNTKKIALLMLLLAVGCATSSDVAPLELRRNVIQKEVVPGVYLGWRTRRLILAIDSANTEAECIVEVGENILKYTRLSTEHLSALSYTAKYEKVDGGCIRWNSGATKDITLMCPPSESINTEKFRAWSEKDSKKYYFFKLVERR